MASPAAVRGIAVRERLLAAAVELIPERGWPAVSTRVLADRAGVTPSVVHYHFPSLQAVLRDAVEVAMRGVLAEVDTFLDSADTPADAVEAMLASVQHYTGTDPMSLLFIEAYLAANRDEHLRERMGEVVDGFRRRFGRWLSERGVDAPEETAAVLVATVDGLLLHRGLGSGPALDVGGVLPRLVNETR